jgi:hypothetical protein
MIKWYISKAILYIRYELLKFFGIVQGVALHNNKKVPRLCRHQHPPLPHQTHPSLSPKDNRHHSRLRWTFRSLLWRCAFLRPSLIWSATSWPHRLRLLRRTSRLLNHINDAEWRHYTSYTSPTPTSPIPLRPQYGCTHHHKTAHWTSIT